MSDTRKTIRFPSDLAAEIERQAEREGRSFSQVVVRRCIATEDLRDVTRAAVQRLAEPKSSRPKVPKAPKPSSEPSYDDIMRERQARLNRR